MRNPIRATFTTPYGTAFGAVRAGGARTHQGWDQHAPEGTAIFAGPHGKVIARGYTSGYGNYADIVYPRGVHIRYAHMQYPAALLHNATWTTAEPQLGQVGLTGSAAYGNPPGAHLHVEVRIDGVLVDPAKFFTPNTTTAGSTGDEIMALDTADKAFLNGLGQAIIEQVLGIAAYASEPGTVASVKDDIHYISNVQAHSLKNIYAKVSALDTTGMTKAILAGLAAQGVTAEVDEEALAAFLKPQFDALHANIDDQPTNFKITPA